MEQPISLHEAPFVHCCNAFHDSTAAPRPLLTGMSREFAHTRGQLSAIHGSCIRQQFSKYWESLIAGQRRKRHRSADVDLFRL